jgi:hypothetical protein
MLVATAKAFSSLISCSTPQIHLELIGSHPGKLYVAFLQFASSEKEVISSPNHCPI